MDMKDKEKIAQWLQGHTAVGVFQNKDLGHPQVGRKVAIPYDYDDLQEAEIGKTTCHDTAELGLGWRYILIAKCQTLQEVVDAMQEEPVESQA